MISKVIRKVRSAFDQLNRLERKINDLHAELLLERCELVESEVRGRVFSQWNEDKILLELIKRLRPPNTFFEFGVEDFQEANCRFLAEYLNWTGVVLDSDSNNKDSFISSYRSWSTNVDFGVEFVTADNVNEIAAKYDVPTHVGVISIDVDGNDVWILEALTAVSADILVVEYNAAFGNYCLALPYEPSFKRNMASEKNLLYGASLSAVTLMAERQGYRFVCVNSHKNNAFFVANSLFDSLELELPDLSGGEFIVREYVREGNRLAKADIMTLSLEQNLVHLPSGKLTSLRDYLEES